MVNSGEPLQRPHQVPTPLTQFGGLPDGRRHLLGA
jgi:hypothetical protein